MENREIRNIEHYQAFDAIDFIDQYYDHEGSFNVILRSIADPVQRDILSGLLRIKRDIGDRDLREYLETQRRKTYQRLFG
ncbi:MAG: hypothetical protein H6573_34405 [Lewinellaceae bacterium]|nr:hypothetical protein [Lewinellaceae bacterium]